MEVSVIIPVYNAAESLAQCLESILAQTYKDFELILVDDCSSDASRNIMSQYAEKDNRIVCLYSSINRGAAEARNRGLEIASGRYLMFADSDDLVADDWIERIVGIQKTDETQLVVSNIIDRYGQDDKARVESNHEHDITAIDYYSLYKFHLDGYLVNKVFDNSVIKSHSLKFNNTLKEGEDVDFIYRYLKCKGIKRFRLIEKPLYIYNRNNSQSVTRTFNPNALSENLHCFECRLPYVPVENRKEFCENYFSYLWGLMGNAHDNRSGKSWFEAMRCNHRTVKSATFRKCFSNSRQAQSDMFLTRVIKTYNYYLIWTYLQANSIIRRK